MQLADVGRNEPCPCGSGRKFKKCCLEAHEAALFGDSQDANVSAMIDHAIASDDWDAVHDLFDQGFELFAPGQPLGHVRLRSDLVAMQLESSDLSKVCTPACLRRCEREILHVVETYELEQADRDGLRMALQLLRRFGARSPLVEELARVQKDERIAQYRKLKAALAAHGGSIDGPLHGGEAMMAWVENQQPLLLSFADWFALRLAPSELAAELWLTGISDRVLDVCLAALEDAECAHAAHWSDVAKIALLGQLPDFGEMLAGASRPRTATDSERVVVAAMVDGAGEQSVGTALANVLREHEERGEFAAADLLRATMSHLVRVAKEER